MKFKDFETIKDNNDLLFILYLAERLPVIKDREIEVEKRNKKFGDEVKRYRSKRFNCETNGIVISKPKIKL